MIDDMDIRTMNLRHVRKHIGLVTQEPVLFDCSIRDNIAYGLGAADHLHADQLFNSVMQAARTANIHNFIVSLPKVNYIIVVSPSKLLKNLSSFQIM